MGAPLIGPSGDRVLVHHHRVYRLDVATGAVVPVAVDAAQIPILERICSFAPLEQHCRQLYQTFEGIADLHQLRSLLREFLQAGFLCEHQNLLQTPQHPGQPVEPFSCVALACGRDPETTRTVIESVIATSAHHSRTPVVLSFQETVDRRHIHRTVAAADQSMDVRVIDRAWFSEWFTPLVSHYPSEDRHALLHSVGLVDAVTFRAGTNRNRLLLLNAGHRLVISDDDQPSRFTWAPDAPARLTSAFSSLEYWPLASQQERDNQFSFDVQDAVAPHEQWLSRDPRTIPHLTPDTLSDPLTRALRTGCPRVRVTTVGLAGDWGRRTPLLLACTQPHLLQTMSEDVLLSTIGVVLAPALTVTDSPLFRSSHCGYDACSVLPPFPGEGRNGDGVFGAALSRLATPGAIAHVPAAVEHLPKQHGLPPQVLQEAGARRNDILLIAIMQIGHTTLEGLSYHLREFAGASAASLAARCIPHIWQHRSTTLTRLADVEEHVDNDDVKCIIQQTCKTLHHEMDQGDLLAPGETWESIREHLLTYARVLARWDDLWNRCRSNPPPPQ